MTKRSVLVMMVLIGAYLPGFAEDTLHLRIERAIVQTLQAQKKAPVVNVRAVLVKPVYMSEVMLRRPRCKDQIVSYKEKTTTCQGVLSNSDQRVYVPSACVSAKDYKLSKVVFTLGNGQNIKSSQPSVTITKEIAFVQLPTQSHAS